MKNYSFNSNNAAHLIGYLGISELSHNVAGEDFYYNTISIKRSSGFEDVLPVLISNRICRNIKEFDNKKVELNGELRSYNEKCETKTKLILNVFVNSISLTHDKDENEIYLFGYLCKKPTYRETPGGRKIGDILLAINRRYNKSDYIPCIAWGRNAEYAFTLDIGESIAVYGRIQSREYAKEDCTKIAYEVSINTMIK